MKRPKPRSFPKLVPSNLKGEIGTNAVATRVIESFGWAFRRTHNEVDFGIDGHLDVIESDGSVTGRQFAVQIKCGQSYFQNENPRGWTYFGEMKHLNYYYNYPTTVLILLVDPQSKEIYWVDFDRQKIVLGNSSWTTVVPKTNRLVEQDKANLVKLLPKVKDIMPELQAFWSLHKIVEDGGEIIFSFALSRVSNQEFTDFERFIERLLQSKTTSKLFESRIEIVFDGFNSDPREVYEIPECSRFLCSLLESNPELIFFLRRARGTSILGVLPLFFSLQRRVGNLTDSDGRLWFEFDPNRFEEFLSLMFLGLTKMANFLSLTKKKRNALFEETVGALNIDQQLKSVLLKELSRMLTSDAN